MALSLSRIALFYLYLSTYIAFCVIAIASFLVISALWVIRSYESSRHCHDVRPSVCLSVCASGTDVQRVWSLTLRVATTSLDLLANILIDNVTLNVPILPLCHHVNVGYLLLS